MSKNDLDKRFSTIAIEKGYVTPKQIAEVLRIQASEELEKGNRRLLGEILLEKKYITIDQVDEVLISMDLL